MMRFSIFQGILYLLLFIISIEGTIALRNLLIGLIFTYLIFNKSVLVETYNSVLSFKELKSLVNALLIFLTYVLVHTLFISEDFSWSLDEWRAQLLYPVIYFFIGLTIANLIKIKKLISLEAFLTAIFFSIFLHIIYIDLFGIDRLIDNGFMIRRYGGLMASPTSANYITNIAIAMLTSEYMYRLRNNKKFLRLPNGFLHFALVASIFSTFFESLRLGDISLVLLGISASFIFVYKNNSFSKNSKVLITSLIILVLSTPLAYNIKSDPRWGKLVETIPLAIDTSKSDHWINKSLPAPKSSSGYEVAGSNYERIAWAKKSIDYIILDPLGIGFGRNAFGHAMRMHHPDMIDLIPAGQTSHSSILDLTVGTGIVGLILWLIFVLKVALYAFKKFMQDGSFFSILTVFITVGYFSRGLVDANMRDHMFLQFMLLLGIIVFYLFSEEKKDEENFSH